MMLQGEAFAAVGDELLQRRSESSDIRVVLPVPLLARHPPLLALGCAEQADRFTSTTTTRITTI
jgi:hypothetical protein